MKKQLICSVVATLLAGPALVSAQSVIVNEWSQGNGGNKEWIEALVVAGPIDLRGWAFTDGTNDQTTAPQLSTDASWSAVPTGTIIVVYNGGDVDTTITPDTNFGDGNFKIVVAHNDATLMVSGRNFAAFANGTLTDSARLLDSTGAVIHDWDQGDNAAFAVATLRPAANQASVYNGNTAPGVATDTNWARVASTAVTPGLPNGSASANETWIFGLRGVTANNPNIDGPTVSFNVGRVDPSASKTANYTVTNTGTSATLTVSGSTITGTNASAFSIISEPTNIAANGGTGILQIQFNPGATEGTYTATLTINSNDSGGDDLIVPLVGVVADVAPYEGLYITEVVTQPTTDEFVEIQNTTTSTIDISGVIISDDDNGNTEGAVKFPAATTLSAGQVIVVAVNTSTTAPTWLASTPSGTTVFYEPLRDGLVNWGTPPSGVTFVAMVDFVVVDGGTSNPIALTATDGVSLYHPDTTFNAGPNSPAMALDGVNFNNTATLEPFAPINSDGDFDTLATRVGAAEPVAGDSFKRLTAAVNVDSSLAFEISTGLTPGVGLGVSGLLSAENWNIYE